MDSNVMVQLRKYFDTLTEEEKESFLAEELSRKRETSKKEFNKIMTKAYDLQKGVHFFDAVFITKKYELFGFIKGNRKINKDNSKRINRSTKVNGQVPIAITTNYDKKKGLYIIADGQHRYDGWATDQEFPIIFTNMGVRIDDETLVKIVTATNTSQSHWVLKNYLEAGAEINVSYKNLLKLFERYDTKDTGNEKIPVWTIINAAVGMCGYSGNGDPKKMVELGLIECTDKFDMICDLLDKLVPIHNKLCSIGFYSKISNKKDRFLSILSFFVQRGKFDSNYFINNMIKYGMTYNFNRLGQEELFNFIQEVYEKGLKPGQKFETDLYMTFVKQNEKARQNNNQLIINAQTRAEANLKVKKVIIDKVYDCAI